MIARHITSGGGSSRHPAFAMFLFLSLLVTGCYSPYVPKPTSNSPTKVAGISLSPSSLSLVAGGSRQLTASLTPSGATNTAVTWNSNSPCAKVSDSGLVEAVRRGQRHHHRHEFRRRLQSLLRHHRHDRRCQRYRRQPE